MRPLDTSLKLFAAALALWALSGCYECTQQNCADGCCSEDGVCIVAASTDEACGTGGFACVSCRNQPGTSCQAGQCLPKCTPLNCASGCCTTSGDCMRFTSQSTYTCGRSGGACSQCASGKDCQSGLCCVTYASLCTTSAECCPGTVCTNVSSWKECR